VEKWGRELIRGCQQLGIRLDEEQVLCFQRYRQQLLFWNRRARLISSRDEEKMLSRHFLDSLSLFQVLDLREGTRILDVGSGGGFPGFPLKICRPEVFLTVLEPKERRYFFLKNLTTTLGLDKITILCQRAQEVRQNPLWRKAFDLVLARAVAEMKELVSICVPFVREGGIFVSYKGRRVEEEMAQARSRVEDLGGQILGLVPVQVPGITARRYLVLIQRPYRDKEVQ